MIQNLGPKYGDSFVRNCEVVHRDASSGEPLFVVDAGYVYARLDGYAIVPLEQFRDLKRRNRPWWKLW